MSDSDSPDNTLHLVERAQSGDDHAIRELFARYMPRARRIAALRLGRLSVDMQDAEDISQEALADAFKNLDRYDTGSDGKFCNWMARLVENRIRMAMRAGRALKRGAGEVKRFADMPESVHDSQLAGGDATPSHVAMGGEAQRKMEEALLAMSERGRELILCRYISQMTYEEIAESMEFSSVDVVRTTYSRALRELRERMG